MKFMTIVGTRPEFVQIAPVTKAIRQHHTEILVNTGQHYDDNMSRIFFRELNLPYPDIDLNVGSGSHARQTGEIMIGLETLMQDHKPDVVVVYGDTNSTLAGAIVAAKLHIPIAHIEAGLRSFDRRMPEEINRIMTDHISTLLFSPTQVAVDNLRNEGITKGVHRVGDVRVDVLHDTIQRIDQRAQAILSSAGLIQGVDFALATIHRPSNTDSKERLHAILEAFRATDLAIILPAHPRLKKMVQSFDLEFSDNVYLIEPVGFLDMVALLDACRIVITDSGGLQKESYMLKRSTITMRDTTEWVETIEAGWNVLCEPEIEVFLSAIDRALHHPPVEHPSLYGEVGVSQEIVDIIAKNL